MASIFLKACIERSGDLDEFWSQLDKMRRDARHLRAALHELDIALRDGTREQDRIRRAIREEADRLGRRLGHLGATTITKLSVAAIELATNPAVPVAVLKLAVTFGLEPVLARAGVSAVPSATSSF